MAFYTTLATTCILSLMIAGFPRFLPLKNLITSEIDVKDFGAIGDGVTDDSWALNQAWYVACGSTGQFKLSTGNFLVGPLTFSGPCKATTVIVNVIGTVTAKTKNDWPNNTDTWLKFQKVDNLVITGTGQFNGQATSGWWEQCKQTHTCEDNPTALAFHACNGLKLVGVTSVNSPRNHISINACDGAIITNVNITAPGDSPNTDGIDISDTNGVNVNGGNIGTGDDCIAINGGSSNINITGLSCGPGHGISVGSLGRNGERDIVSNIMVVGATFTGTQNGVRIKTVPGGSGSASQITYRNIRMTDVENPILLTQFYCPHVDPKNCPDIEPVVQINGVSFIDINGTSSTGHAVDIKCSKYGGSCVGITLGQINIQPVNSSIKVESTCQNTQVGFQGPVFPPVVCIPSSVIMMQPLDHAYNKGQQANLAS